MTGLIGDGRWLHVSHQSQMVREEIGIRELGGKGEDSMEERDNGEGR